MIGFLWLPKIQHAGLTHGFQVSIVAYLFLIVCLFLYVRLICFRLLPASFSICLRLTEWPVCGMRLLRLPGGVVV